MMGHKICFYGVMWLIIPILSPLLLLIWSTALLFALSVTQYTVELHLLEHPWNHENMFETGEVRANEC